MWDLGELRIVLLAANNLGNRFVLREWTLLFGIKCPYHVFVFKAFRSKQQTLSYGLGPIFNLIVGVCQGYICKKSLFHT